MNGVVCQAEYVGGRLGLLIRDAAQTAKSALLLHSRRRCLAAKA
jgi:hypothetical protein